MGDLTMAGIEMTSVECGKCGAPFAMSDSYIESRRSDHRTWYCPNGCRRHYPAKNAEELLAEKLKYSESAKRTAIKCCSRLEGETAHAKAQARGHKSAFTRLKRKTEPEEQEVTT